MKHYLLSAISAFALSSGCALHYSAQTAVDTVPPITLPEPRWSSEVSVEQALKNRRSIRSFQQQPLTLMEVSQLLWAAQGVTASRFRTTPSAGALYPLEVYLVAGDVDELEVGVYRYDSQIHGLKKVVTGDVRKSLANATYWQEWVGNGAIALVFTGIYERTTGKYGPRGQRYVHMEAGHAAQNVFLQAEALGLGTVIVGAFMDSRVTSVLQLSEDEHPLSIMPVGRK